MNLTKKQEIILVLSLFIFVLIVSLIANSLIFHGQFKEFEEAKEICVEKDRWQYCSFEIDGKEIIGTCEPTREGYLICRPEKPGKLNSS